MAVNYGGALSGAASGAALGSQILPGWGTAIGGVAGGVIGLFSGGKKKGSAMANPADFMIDVPEFWQDPYYAPTQDMLFDVGEGLLAGEPNEYYAPIGEMGGDLYQDVLGRSVRDTVIATEEDAVRRGVSRGGNVSTAISKNVADLTSKMNWADYMRALEGREFLLTTGVNTIGGVGDRSLTNQGQKNQFELERARIEMANLKQGFELASGANGAIAESQSGGVMDSTLSFIKDYFPSKNPNGERGSAAYSRYKDPGFYLEAAKIAQMFMNKG